MGSIFNLSKQKYSFNSFKYKNKIWKSDILKSTNMLIFDTLSHHQHILFLWMKKAYNQFLQSNLKINFFTIAAHFQPSHSNRKDRMPFLLPKFRAVLKCRPLTNQPMKPFHNSAHLWYHWDTLHCKLMIMWWHYIYIHKSVCNSFFLIDGLFWE